MSKTKKRDKYLRLYQALLAYENQNKSFTRQDLANKTDYTVGTAGVYIRNKLKDVYLKLDTKAKQYTVTGIKEIDYKSFARLMSQKTVVSDSSVSQKYAQKSVEAFYNALANYNNVMNKYRFETFCILVINAWELLLKARLIETKGEGSIKIKNGNSISFKTAINEMSKEIDEPVRKNLTRLKEIRDVCVHAVTSYNLDILEVLYGSVLNYTATLRKFNYENPYEK